ncbi:MAG: response regulator transcription factor [Hyphomonadaceae bacterium]|nr:response regulator transcription factor [Hyphomonadaceae bacterium]
MWRTILIFGGILAVAAFGLQWLEYQLLARTHPGELYIVLLALGFMGLGVWAGSRLFPRQPVGEAFVVNARVKETLGISEREFEVLGLLAAGRSNKEIASQLHVSPNTVKTHVAKLYGKLEVTRRTEAVMRARELGMLQ